MAWFTNVVVLLTCIACNVLSSTVTVMPANSTMMIPSAMSSSQVVDKDSSAMTSKMIQATTTKVLGGAPTATAMTSARANEEASTVSSNMGTDQKNVPMPSSVVASASQNATSTTKAPGGSSGFIVPNLIVLGLSSLVFYLF